jgi:hypothetical protein
MQPVCSFCGGSQVVSWFEGPDFRVAVDSADKVRAEEAWLVCSTCRALVDADDRQKLVERAWNRPAGWTVAPPSRAQLREHFDRLFWAPRSA